MGVAQKSHHCCGMHDRMHNLYTMCVVLYSYTIPISCMHMSITVDEKGITNDTLLCLLNDVCHRIEYKNLQNLTFF